MTGWLRSRRAVDLPVAVALTALAAPALAVAVAAVRRHDRGPGLIRLERVGREGRPFRQWKLRSMRAAGDHGLSEGPPITVVDDSRVTPLGRFLRKYRIDEVPQLLNVVAGEMALVGPRPEAASYVDLKDPRWRAVLTVRPGIVGPTQVLVADWEADMVARSQAPDAYRAVVLPLKLAVDLWYVRNASPRIDFLVVAALVRRFTGSARSSALFARVTTEVPQAHLLCD